MGLNCTQGTSILTTYVLIKIAYANPSIYGKKISVQYNTILSEYISMLLCYNHCGFMNTSYSIFNDTYTFVQTALVKAFKENF